MNVRNLHLLFAAPLVLGTLFAQTTIKKAEIKFTSVTDGADMYHSYCAACHGQSGKGDGPAAKATKIPPTDLTTMAQYNQGEFPTHTVMSTLNQARGSHGSEDMPVWGRLFRSLGGGDNMVALRTYNLTSYLESIQEPAEKPAKTPKPERFSISEIPVNSGSAMYHSLCASCHGVDGRGQGPAAATLKTVPTDLSLLARNNNAKFPALRVGEVLGRRPGAEAHGTEEMPVWGNVFRATQHDKALATMRIANLVRYLELLQR